MENRVKEICKSKGLRMSDLAERVGMSQSNLSTTLRRNPKLSTLKDIADALGIRVSDIIDPQRATSEAGVVIINGETYVLSKPSPEVVQVPVFKDYSVLRAVVKEFVNKSIKGAKNSAICGLVETFELFNLHYDAEAERFHLTLCYGGGLIHTSSYDKLEYAFDDEWKADDVYQNIINDIEGLVLYKFGHKASITQEEIDEILFAPEER